MNKFLIVDTNEEVYEIVAQLNPEATFEDAKELLEEKFIEKFGYVGLSIYKKVDKESHLPPFVELISECQRRDWNISLTWQKINEWSVEIYTGYKSSYEKKYYTDGHMTKEVAIETALEFFEEFNKLGK